MMADEMTRLLSLANAATPGPWQASVESGTGRVERPTGLAVAWCGGGTSSGPAAPEAETEARPAPERDPVTGEVVPDHVGRGQDEAGAGRAGA